MGKPTEAIGLTQRIRVLLASYPERALTLGQIAAGLHMERQDHAAINASLVKLRNSGRAKRTTVPATSTKGRREIAAYQHTLT